MSYITYLTFSHFSADLYIFIYIYIRILHEDHTSNPYQILFLKGFPFSGSKEQYFTKINYSPETKQKNKL